MVPRYSTREFGNINFIDVFEPNQNMSMKGSPLLKLELKEVVGDIITSWRIDDFSTGLGSCRTEIRECTLPGRGLCAGFRELAIL